MTMSVVASTLSTVGIRNSALGLLELMWYPLETRNESGTVAGLPCTTVTTGAGAIFTAGPCGPRSSCAHAENRRSALAASIFIGYPCSRRLRGETQPLKGRFILKLTASLKRCPDTNPHREKLSSDAKSEP